MRDRAIVLRDGGGDDYHRDDGDGGDGARVRQNLDRDPPPGHSLSLPSPSQTTNWHSTNSNPFLVPIPVTYKQQNSENMISAFSSTYSATTKMVMRFDDKNYSNQYSKEKLYE
jgi:hypothetical protein